MPLMTAEIKWFKSPNVGVVNFNVLKQMSYNASLSKTMHSSQRVTNLEALQAIARLGFFTHDVQHRVNQLSTFRVVAFGPVVTSASLSERKVIRTENLSVRTRPDRVHRPGFQIDQTRSRNVSTAGGFVEVHVDALEL
jgi:hypothetical protein